MGKYTSGPWKIRRGRTSVTIVTGDAVNHIGSPRVIARIGPLGEWAATRHERDANAVLIAAAPEMYRELVELAADLARCASVTISRDSEKHRRIRDAIAKAEDSRK